MQFIDVFYTSPDGITLYARDYAGPRADAPAILCMHGLTRNSKDFAELAADLSQHYRVIVAEQRGRGRSAWDPQPERYRPDVYVKDMLQLLDVCGVKQAHLIGTSMGGIMAMLMIATARERVLSAVLNDVGPEVDPTGLARIAGYVGKVSGLRNWDDAIARTKFINGVAFPAFTEAQWQDMAAKLFVLRDGVPVLDYDPAIAAGVSSGTAAPNLWPLFDLCKGVPMLAIRGETSDILAPATLAQMGERVPGMQAVSVANVGHAPTLDEPVARAAIHAFLQAQA